MDRWPGKEEELGLEQEQALELELPLLLLKHRMASQREEWKKLQGGMWVPDEEEVARAVVDRP